MKKPTFRRILAFIIDMLIVTLIATAISNIKALNPSFDKYEQAEFEFLEKVNTYYNEPNSEEMLTTDELMETSYYMTLYGVYTTMYSIIVTALYFVGFQYYTKGKTLGKKLMRIEVISLDKKDPTIMQLLLRSLIINNLFFSVVICILVTVMSKSAFMKVNNYIQIAEYGLILLNYGFILYREDGVGLHDLLGHTRVIASEDKEYYLKHVEKEN